MYKSPHTAPAFTLVGAMKLCALLLTSPHPLFMALDRLAGIDRSRLRPATKITTRNLSISFFRFRSKSKMYYCM